MGTYLYPVVNARNEVICSVTKESLLEEEDRMHRSVYVFIEVKGGSFVLRRMPNGIYTAPVRGHVRTDENYKQAAARLISFKAGLIPLDLLDLIFEAAVPASKTTGNEFANLYSFLMDPEVEYFAPCGNRTFIVQPLTSMIKHIDENTHLYDPVFIYLLNVFLSYNNNAVNKLIDEVSDQGVDKCQLAHNQIQIL